MSDLENSIELGSGTLTRLAKSAQIAKEQLRLAEILVTEDLGIGGKHEQREQIIATVAQVIATNHAAQLAFIKK